MFMTVLWFSWSWSITNAHNQFVSNLLQNTHKERAWWWWREIETQCSCNSLKWGKCISLFCWDRNKLIAFYTKLLLSIFTVSPRSSLKVHFHQLQQAQEILHCCGNSFYVLCVCKCKCKKLVCCKSSSSSVDNDAKMLLHTLSGQDKALHWVTVKSVLKCSLTF
jgi:hypothetical protein